MGSDEGVTTEKKQFIATKAGLLRSIQSQSDFPNVVKKGGLG